MVGIASRAAAGQHGVHGRRHQRDAQARRCERGPAEQ
jgi:hypothetical protein